VSDPRFDRAAELFLEAAEMSAADRGAFLAELTRTDPDLGAAVRELLRGDGLTALVLDRGPAPELLATALAAELRPDDGDRLPAEIGPYRILAKLGEGGMGVVYEAEQESPRRTVALKVLRQNLGSGDRERRFRREIEVLARLDHPGIVRIHEAGVTAEGAAYFSLERVHGCQLAEYVRRAGLVREELLSLVAKLCDALQHANERGVVHRDLKPGNVMVDDRGAPRLLDFGIASAQALEDLAATQVTQAGTVLGTLAYMSPEQAAADGRPVDARSDVYSVGVMLYELLGGSLPLTLAGRPLHEALRSLQEDDPPRLSSLDRHWAGDVETVVHKALEKQPSRRYPSAAALAADLRRVLGHEPIEARPTSVLYRGAKFCRRHRGLVVGTCLAFAASLAGTVLATWQAGRALRASALAREETRRAERQAYLAAIQGAEAALGLGDGEMARALLEAAPAPRRGFEWHHLQARLDDCLELFALGAAPLAATFAGSAPGSELLVFTADGELLRLSADLERELERRTESGGPFRCAALAEDGSALVSLDGAGDLRQHDLSGAPARVRASLAQVTSLTVTSGGRRLAGTFGDNRAFWAAEGAAEVATVAERGLESAAFLGDGQTLHCGSTAGQVFEVDCDAGTVTQVYRGDPSDVRHLAASADGDRLAIGHDDRRVFVLDRRDGRLRGPYLGNLGTLLACDLSPDGRWLATSGGDGLVRVWDLDQGSAPRTLLGHRGAVTAVHFGPTGDSLVSLGADRTLRLWRVDGDSRSRVLRGHGSWVYPVAFTADGERLLSGSWDGTVRQWDAGNGEPRGILLPSGVGSPVLALALSPDGRTAALGWQRTRAQLFDLATGSLLAPLLSGPPSSAEALAYDASGARLAALRFDGVHHQNVARVSLFDARTASERWSATVPSNGHGGLAFHEASDSLLVTTKASLYALSLDDGRERLVVRVPAGAASLTLDPARALLATGHGNGAVVLRDPWTLEANAELSGHRGQVYALAFSPDGTRLASGARDGQILLWDPHTGDRLGRLAGHDNYVYSLAFSPDGTRLASGSGDFTVRLWDTVPKHQR
jgi:WD40 repeat protein